LSDDPRWPDVPKDTRCAGSLVSGLDAKYAVISFGMFVSDSGETGLPAAGLETATWHPHLQTKRTHGAGITQTVPLSRTPTAVSFANHWVAQTRPASDAVSHSSFAAIGLSLSKKLEVLRMNQRPSVRIKSLQSLEQPILQQSVRHVRHETRLNPRRTQSNPTNAVYHYADLHGIEGPAGRRASPLIIP
jgi:hypothetical protein